MLELAILGLLKEFPLHGYELKKRLNDTLGHVWGVSYGSLYPALARLEGQLAIGGLVRRFPNLELAGEPEWNGRLNLRGLARLPVAPRR